MTGSVGTVLVTKSSSSVGSEDSKVLVMVVTVRSSGSGLSLVTSGLSEALVTVVTTSGLVSKVLVTSLTVTCGSSVTSFSSAEYFCSSLS